MATSTPIPNLSAKSQEGIIQYYRACSAILATTWNFREQLLYIDRQYMRENDFSSEQVRARIANRYGDQTKYQNVTVPVVMPQVETAVTYQSSVFLTGIPLFGVSASAKYMDAALQMETIIDHQAQKGGWVNQIEMTFRDAFKYNFAACEVTWCRKKIWTPETNPDFSRDQGKPVETYWEGNAVKRLDPYNMIFDARYKPTEIAERGEFSGYTEIMSKTELLRYMNSLPFRMNYKAAFESTPSTVGTAYPTSYYIPELNPDALLSQNLYQTTNWLVWAGLSDATRNGNINFKNVYFVTTFYARIQPADFLIGSPAPHLPQIWKFIIVNGNTVVYAERQTNAHDMIPILYMQPQEDGLGYQTKSFAQNVVPYQQIASALMNSAMASRRRSISDRGIYDPSRINAKDINSDSPNAKIPVRPAAYGKPLNEAYYPIPYRDDQLQFAMSDMAQMLQFADRATGQNAAQQGQFVKGNKTLFEYQDIMGNANGRSQSQSIKLETQFFAPLKYILKLNVLQYQQPGSVYSREQQTEIDIDPVVLRSAVLEFKVSDGATPASKQVNSETFAAATQAIAATPALAAEYNIGDVFAYLFKTQRADVGQFRKSREQITYEQALSSWQATVAALSESYSKLKKPDGSGYTPEEIQSALPPQPTPEQFGYNPQAAVQQSQIQSQPGPTVLQQYAQISAPPQTQQVGTPANADTSIQ